MTADQKPGVLIGGIPGTDTYYVGDPTRDAGARIEGLEDVSSFVRNVFGHNVSLGFVGVPNESKTRLTALITGHPIAIPANSARPRSRK